MWASSIWAYMWVMYLLLVISLWQGQTRSPEKRCSGYSSHGFGVIICKRTKFLFLHRILRLHYIDTIGNYLMLDRNPIFSWPFFLMWNTLSSLAGNGLKCLWILHGCWIFSYVPGGAPLPHLFDVEHLVDLALNWQPLP